MDAEGQISHDSTPYGATVAKTTDIESRVVTASGWEMEEEGVSGWHFMRQSVSHSGGSGLRTPRTYLAVHS